MTNDSHLFHTSKALVEDGFFLSAGNLYQRGKEKFLPLYKGKMVQMYDHRAAGIKVNSANVHRPAQEAPTTAAQYLDLDYSPKPQF